MTEQLKRLNDFLLSILLKNFQQRRHVHRRRPVVVWLDDIWLDSKQQLLPVKLIQKFHENVSDT